MDYEIYQAKDGNKRVNIGSESYALLYPRSAEQGDVLGGRQLAQVEAGDYGPTVQAWAAAAREVGAPLRFAWQGVINAMGDMGEVKPPWKPREKDWGRASE